MYKLRCQCTAENVRSTQGHTCDSALDDCAVLQLNLYCLIAEFHEKPAEEI